MSDGQEMTMDAMPGDGLVSDGAAMLMGAMIAERDATIARLEAEVARLRRELRNADVALADMGERLTKGNAAMDRP